MKQEVKPARFNDAIGYNLRERLIAMIVAINNHGSELTNGGTTLMAPTNVTNLSEKSQVMGKNPDKDLAGIGRYR